MRNLYMYYKRLKQYITRRQGQNRSQSQSGPNPKAIEEQKTTQGRSSSQQNKPFNKYDMKNNSG